MRRRSTAFQRSATVPPVSTYTDDTGAAVAGTNWTVTHFVYMVTGGNLLSMRLRVERTGTALTPNAEGDFSNEVLATLATNLRTTAYTSWPIPLSAGTSGRVVSASYNPGIGTVVLTASAGAGDAIDVGEGVSVGGSGIPLL